MEVGDTRPMTNCKFCSEDMTNRMQCHQLDGSAWKYLNKNESCHLECYIEQCVKVYLEKLNK